MQKMSYFFNLLIANTIPQDIAAGKAGGIVIVNRSRARSMINIVGTFILSYIGTVASIPISAKSAIIPTNLIPS